MQANRSARRGLAIASAAVAVAWLASAPAARAQAQPQGSSPRDAAAARALFMEGVGCADRQDWVCAADRFERAYALRSSPVLAYNLGHAMVQLGRLVEGAEMLLRATRDETASSQVRADAQRMVAELTPRIGRLTLRLAGPREGVTIRIGQTEIPEALHGTAAPIDPGEHTISAIRGGETVASTTVQVADGASVEAELTIPEAPVVALAEPGPDEGERGAAEDAAAAAIGATTTPSGSDEGLWIGLGVGAGAVVIGVAVVLGVVLGQPHDAAPFGGNLGVVEVGR